MPSLNSIFLLGSLTRSPTFHQMARGTPVTSFDLQVEVPAREKVCVIRVVIFDKQAEAAARHLGRGSIVFVAGHLRQREIVTREGEKHRALEVVAERVEFLSQPADHPRDIARTLIDPPAMVPDADPPAHFDERDPPSPDE